MLQQHDQAVLSEATVMCEACQDDGMVLCPRCSAVCRECPDCGGTGLIKCKECPELRVCTGCFEHSTTVRDDALCNECREMRALAGL